MDYFAANDLAAFLTSSGAPTEDATAGRFDPLYATKSINTNGGTGDFVFVNPDTGALVTLTQGWVHHELLITTGNVNQPTVHLLNDAGTPVMRLFVTSTGQIRCDYWSGAAWVVGGAVFQLNANARTALDLHFVCGAGGSMDLYVNNSPGLSIAGLNAAVTNVAKGRIGSSSTIVRYSQVLVSDESTVAAKVSSLVPNANGTYTAWANDYASLVKVGYNDATLISSSVLAANESYAASDAALPPNYVISSVWLAIRARLNASAPANIKPLFRIDAADYLGAYNFPNLNAASYGPSLAGFSLNPNGGVAWTIADINAAELGFQAVA